MAENNSSAPLKTAEGAISVTQVELTPEQRLGLISSCKGPLPGVEAQAPTAVTVPDEREAMTEARALLKKYLRLCEEIKRGDSHHLQRIDRAITALAATPALPATEDSSAGDMATESVLIEGVAYTIPEAVALELLRLNIELQLAEVQAEPVAWADWKVGSNSYDLHRTRQQAEASVRQSELAAPQEGPYEVVPLYTAPQAQPADALLLDYLQATGSTVEIIPGPTGGWNFRAGGLYTTARSNLRSSIDAAMAAAQEGGNAAKEA